MYTNNSIQETLKILEKTLIDTGLLDKEKIKELIFEPIENFIRTELLCVR